MKKLLIITVTSLSLFSLSARVDHSIVSLGLYTSYDSAYGLLGDGYTNFYGEIQISPTTQALIDSKSDSNLVYAAISLKADASSTTSALAGKADSSATTTALASKEPSITAGTSSQYWRGDKTWQAFPSQVNADWTAVSGASFIANKPSLKTVALTGNYSDLSGLPLIPTIPTRVFSGATRTIVTVAAAGNGWQPSSGRDVFATYSVTITSASSLTSGSSGYVALEIASSNSSTASDWIEIGRTTNGQNNGLVLGLSLSQPGGSPIVAMIPAGYYARLRSVNSVGTPTFVYNSGEEVQL